jgi:hypothetical protein
MTQLRAETPLPVVWLWMFIAGLGVGPTFAVFTLIVQNAVPFNMLGVATSNLTFFRQIGGTVALAIVGTIFSSSLLQELGPQLAAAGTPQPLVDNFTAAINSGAVDFQGLTGTGDLGASILANAGPAAPAIEPYITNIVSGIHQAFSLGVAQTFWVGVGAAVLAALAAAAMQELALRRGHAPAGAATNTSASSTPDGARPALPAAD